jgi:predicted transcriptional regulator
MKLRSDLSFYEIATALRPRNTGLLPVIHNDEIATHLKDACSLLDVAYLDDVAVKQVDCSLGVCSDVGVVGH